MKTKSADIYAFTKKFNGIVPQILSDAKVVSMVPSSSYPEMVKVTALWDTGATNAVITKRVVEELGLKNTGYVDIAHAGGISTFKKYIISVCLPNDKLITGLVATEAPLGGFDMLIGMDIITLGDFSITNKDGKTCFSFRIPSLDEVDYSANPA